MDLASPIRSIVPSLDGPVLQALAQTNAPASLSTIHRRAGTGSLSGVRNVLERLREHGVVERGPAGYRLNRDHLAADQIIALANLRGRFCERVTGWLAERPEVIVAAGIYGSFARRDGSERSDIDLLVITSDPDDVVALRDELSEAVRSWTGNDGQVVVLTPADVSALRERGEPITNSWVQDLQMLLGDHPMVVS